MIFKEEFLKYLNLKIVDIFILNCIKNEEINLLNTSLKLDNTVSDHITNLLERQVIYAKDNFYEISYQYNKALFPTKSEVQVKVPDISELVEEYRNIFPKGNNSQGYPYKGDKMGCTAKLKRFKKTYPEYSNDTILSATKRYVNEKRKDGFAYMKLAHYFIEKNGVSDLAALCEQINNGEKDTNFTNIINF